jgi:hypothetical protein
VQAARPLLRAEYRHRRLASESTERAGQWEVVAHDRRWERSSPAALKDLCFPGQERVPWLDLLLPTQVQNHGQLLLSVARSRCSWYSPTFLSWPCWLSEPAEVAWLPRSRGPHCGRLAGLAGPDSQWLQPAPGTSCARRAAVVTLAPPSWSGAGRPVLRRLLDARSGGRDLLSHAGCQLWVSPDFPLSGSSLRHSVLPAAPAFACRS